MDTVIKMTVGDIPLAYYPLISWGIAAISLFGIFCVSLKTPGKSSE